MKIWIINHNAMPPKYGALVRHYYFGRYLHTKGDEVTVFTSSQIHNTNLNLCKKDEPYTLEKIHNVTYVYVRNRGYKGNGPDRIFNMLQFAWKAGRLDKIFDRPDLIYVSSPDIFAAYTAQKMAKRIKVPFLLETRDLWPDAIVEVMHISSKNILIQILFLIEKKLYRKADKLIFTMPGGKQYIKDKKWDKEIDLNKIVNINNGVDLEEFNQNVKKYPLKSDALDQSGFKVVYCGSIRQANNIGAVIDAARIIKKRGLKDIIFLIYGDGGDREALQETAEQEKLPIYFEGKVDRRYIPYILSKSDLNILNYADIQLMQKYGSSSNKLFEYIAAGKPIISNVMLMNDIIVSNGLGSARKFADADKYADEILKYYYMEEAERAEIKERAKEVIKEYDYTALSEKVYKVIHEIS